MWRFGIVAGMLVLCSLIGVCIFAGGQTARPIDLFIIYEKGRYGYIDRSGKIVIEPKFFEASDFVDGLASVEITGPDNFAGRVLIDTSGQIAVSPKIKVYRLDNFSEGLALVSVSFQGIPSNGLGYIDRNGDVAIKPQFEKASAFKEGMARVYRYDKYGFIDKTGKLIVDYILDEAGDFHNGLAHVRVGSRWGYIDKSGAYVWRSSN